MDVGGAVDAYFSVERDALGEILDSVRRIE
jgi:hypothetical protein